MEYKRETNGLFTNITEVYTTFNKKLKPFD